MAVVAEAGAGREGSLAARRMQSGPPRRLFDAFAGKAIGRRIGITLLILLLGFLTVYPLSMLLYGSLHSTPPGMAGEFNLDGYRDILTGMRAQVADAIREGRSLDEIKALRIADRYGRATDFIPPDAFIESLYRSLTAAHVGDEHHH